MSSTNEQGETTDREQCTHGSLYALDVEANWASV
jgi:hypothetical protein